jgi:hypothetical protein
MLSAESAEPARKSRFRVQIGDRVYDSDAENEEEKLETFAMRAASLPGGLNIPAPFHRKAFAAYALYPEALR